MKIFANKNILITGAASGIGRELTQQLLHANLILLDRDAEKISLPNDNAYVQCADLSNPQQLQKAIDNITARYSHIDYLVLCAGISQRCLATHTEFSTDRLIMEVNYFANIFLTKAFLPYMKNNKFGHIVVISSLMGKFSSPLRSAYCASKHALHGFFNALRLELQTFNIKITIVCPGFVNTNISYNAVNGEGEATCQHDPQTQKGLSPKICAEQILKAIKAQKKEVFIGGNETYLVQLHKFFPMIHSWIMRSVRVR